VEAAVPSVWPLTRAVAATNVAACVLLAFTDDSAASLIARVVWITLWVAVPIVLLSTILGALGHWYRLPYAFVMVAAPLLSWMTWGLMIASEGAEEEFTALLLLVAQGLAIALVLRAPQPEQV
jgi:hypothetical protein